MREDLTSVCVILTAQRHKILSPRSVSNLNRIASWIPTWVSFPQDQICFQVH